MKEKQSAVIAIAAKLTDPDIAKVTTRKQKFIATAPQDPLLFNNACYSTYIHTHTYTNGINTVNVLVVISFWPPVLR